LQRSIGLDLIKIDRLRTLQLTPSGTISVVNFTSSMGGGASLPFDNISEFTRGDAGGWVPRQCFELASD
jgi:hypothetical protein